MKAMLGTEGLLVDPPTATSPTTPPKRPGRDNMEENDSTSWRLLNEGIDIKAQSTPAI